MRKNHGLVWNGKDLRYLRDELEKGVPLRLVAFRLGREPSACIAQLVILRKARLVLEGKDDDTIKNFKMDVNL